MIVKERNLRNEVCNYDTETRQFWTGTDTDKESRIVCALCPALKLICQFYSVSPYFGEKVDVDFDTSAHSVAKSCIGQERTSVSPRGDAEREMFSAIWQYATRIRNNNEIVGAERLVFSPHSKVAGIVDLLFRCNGKLFLCDWKTGNVMLPAKCKFNAPFSHLVADPLTIYSLQCSMLQVIIETGAIFSGEEFAASRILWVHRSESGKPVVDAITCRDLRREAAMMMAMLGYTPWYVEWEKSFPF